MKTREKLARLKDDDYQKFLGVTKPVFDMMLKVLNEEYRRQHQKGVRLIRSLSITDKLVIMLQYYREYRTKEHMAFDYSISKSTVCESIQWAENRVKNTFIKIKEFTLPSKREFVEDGKINTVIIDVTEYEIERPKKNRKIIIMLEHVNRYIKRFRILSGRYRNRHKRFGLRVNLICGVVRLVLLQVIH